MTSVFFPESRKRQVESVVQFLLSQLMNVLGLFFVIQQDTEPGLGNV